MIDETKSSDRALLASTGEASATQHVADEQCHPADTLTMERHVRLPLRSTSKPACGEIRTIFNRMGHLLSSGTIAIRQLETE